MKVQKLRGSLVSTGEVGTVIGILEKLDEVGSQSMVMVFVKDTDGSVSEQVDTNVIFTDHMMTDLIPD